MSEELPVAVTRLWTEPGLRKRADVMFDLLSGVDRSNVSNLVTQLATLNEFWLIMRLLDAIDFGVPATAAIATRPEVNRKIRNLAKLGEAVLNIDAHDFESWLTDDDIPQHIKDQLQTRAWPMHVTDTPVSPLSSLVPTFELLLEVFEVRVLKGDVTMGLSILHLMTEYLPLLGWEQQLGHAGNPKQLDEHLNQPGAMWQTEACPLNRQQRKAFADVSNASESARDWNTYLRDTHSRVAAALSICGGVPNPVSEISGQRTCRTSCAVRKENAQLSWAMVLVRRLRDSAVLTLRHDAPVGHFFSVPQEPQILASWETTWQGLLADRDEAPAVANPLRNLPRTGALAGLPELLGVVAGKSQALQPSNVVGLITNEIRQLSVAMT